MQVPQSEEQSTWNIAIDNFTILCQFALYEIANLCQFRNCEILKLTPDSFVSKQLNWLTTSQLTNTW